MNCSPKGCLGNVIRCCDYNIILRLGLISYFHEAATPVFPLADVETVIHLTISSCSIFNVAIEDFSTKQHRSAPDSSCISNKHFDFLNNIRQAWLIPHLDKYFR
jgi:hypothetical protein